MLEAVSMMGPGRLLTMPQISHAEVLSNTFSFGPL